MTYVCGHSSNELERLEAQSLFFEDISRRLLEQAGIGPGLRVLDIGCGVGDLTFLAADLVGAGGPGGPGGHVVGIDRAPEAVETAARRAAARGVRNAAFRVADIGALPAAGAFDARFDALVGRFVLMHQRDPAAVLAGAAHLVRAGGTVAILESHMHASVAGAHSYPYSPTYDRILRWIVRIIEAAGAHADMGLRLQRTFTAAGLPSPTLSMQARVDGRPDAAIYRYITDSLRSMRPLGERLGIVTLSPDEIDELACELRDEVTASGGVLVSPLVVGAWCRLPEGDVPRASGAENLAR